MLGFEPRISDVGSDGTANLATTTALRSIATSSECSEWDGFFLDFTFQQFSRGNKFDRKSRIPEIFFPSNVSVSRNQEKMKVGKNFWPFRSRLIHVGKIGCSEEIKEKGKMLRTTTDLSNIAELSKASANTTKTND